MFMSFERSVKMQQDFANALKARRLALGYTHAYIAEKLNVNQASVSNWERGKNIPCRKYHRPLAAILNCTPSDLHL